MKNQFSAIRPTLSAALLSMTILVSCSKKDSAGTTTPLSTSLQITVVDNSAVRQAGATVSLYTSQTNFFTETGAIASGTTDGNGQITFTNLQPVRYWYIAKKSCMNNANSTTSTANAITANSTSSINTVVASTGTLKFVNTSSNPYHVYVNGTAFPDMPGGTTVSYNYELAGSYTIRVIQISGYAVTPTDHSFQGTLACGGMLTTTFP